MKVSVIIGDAGPKGKGVFAAAPIAPSTKVAGYYGRPRWIWDIPEELWPYTIQVDYDKYVLPRRNGVIWYMNHSCEPNCLISGKYLVAGRAVNVGEELTFDYSTDVDWSGFSMRCRCGSPDCRKTARAYRFLPARVKRVYGRNVAPFILREYFRAPPGVDPAALAGTRSVLRSP